MSSSCLLWFLTSLSSCVISRHLKSWVLYKCMQHSSIIHCFSLPDCCRFFFPPPFCGSWPISSVRAPDSEWNITVLFGTAPPNHFLRTSAHKKRFLLWCHKNGVSAGFYYLSSETFDAVCHYIEPCAQNIYCLSEDLPFFYECIVKTFHVTHYASVFFPRSDITYSILFEAVTTLLVFFSYQLFHKEILRNGIIYQHIMKGRWYGTTHHLHGPV